MSNEIQALIIAKNRDYLLGYIDCMIQMKNQAGCERLDISQGQVVGSPEQNNVLGPVYLDLTCKCGNYVAFKDGNQIPSKSFKCGLCDEMYMIFYTDEKVETNNEAR
jgi:hypothetical protein